MKNVLACKNGKVIALHDDWQNITDDLYPGCEIICVDKSMVKHEYIGDGESNVFKINDPRVNANQTVLDEIEGNTSKYKLKHKE